jgi:hypothetical protein
LLCVAVSTLLVNLVYFSYLLVLSCFGFSPATVAGISTKKELSRRRNRVGESKDILPRALSKFAAGTFGISAMVSNSI